MGFNSEGLLYRFKRVTNEKYKEMINILIGQKNLR